MFVEMRSELKTEIRNRKKKYRKRKEGTCRARHAGGGVLLSLNNYRNGRRHKPEIRCPIKNAKGWRERKRKEGGRSDLLRPLGRGRMGDQKKFSAAGWQSLAIIDREVRGERNFQRPLEATLGWKRRARGSSFALKACLSQPRKGKGVAKHTGRSGVASSGSRNSFQEIVTRGGSGGTREWVRST